MERMVDYKYAELILAGFDKLPSGIANRLKYTHFFTGTDPIYAGLIANGKISPKGDSYHNTWCVSHQHHLTRFPVANRQTTVTLSDHSPEGYPRLLLPMLIVHELGHVLHEIIGFEHSAEPISKYARLNKWEAFAEAFTSWVDPLYGQYYKLTQRVDECSAVLFRELDILWSK